MRSLPFILSHYHSLPVRWEPLSPGFHVMCMEKGACALWEITLLTSEKEERFASGKFSSKARLMWLKRVFIVGVVVLVIGGSGSASWARDPEGARAQDIVDLLVLRPLGFVATVAGTGVFVLTLPFTVPTHSVDKSAERFVVAPFNYTFKRPFPDENL